MQARTTISCGDDVSFVISFGVPTALRHPLWLRLPSNENLPKAGKHRLYVVESESGLVPVALPSEAQEPVLRARKA